jgi:hypothetical protein
MLLIYCTILLSPLQKLAAFSVMTLVYGQQFPLLVPPNYHMDSNSNISDVISNRSLSPDVISSKSITPEPEIITNELFQWLQLDRISRYENYALDPNHYNQFYYDMSVALAEITFGIG